MLPRALAICFESSNNGRMITMNEPQVWTLIGMFGAMMVGLITIITQTFMRTMSAKFETVNERIDGFKTEMVLRFERVDERMDEGFKLVDRRFEQVDRQFEQVDRRLDKVDQRLDKLDTRVNRIEVRLDGLDRDVHAITKKAFPIED